VLASSNSSFVIETHGGGGGGSFSLGASNIGNTLGDTGVTGSRVVLAGIGNLTLSQATDANGGTISISGGTAGGGGVAISASNSLFSSGTVVLTGTGGGVTVDTQAAGTIRISVAAPVAQSVQTQNRFNLTLDGNTAGALAEVSSGTLTLAGGNGITLSQAGNAITISGSTFSQSVQPETQTFIGGISGSNTLYTSGTVRLTGAGNITVASGTGQQIIISGSQSVQPETQTFVGGIAGSNTTYTSGTIRITGVGGGVTVSSNTGQRIDISVAAQSVQPETQTFVGGVIASDTTYTSGSIRFTGVGGGVTVSSNTGQRVDISVAAQSVQTQNMIAMTLSGNTSGAQALISSGTMTLAGGNNITVSQNGNAVTISGPNVGGAQTGISGIIGSDATYTSGTVQFTGSNMITVKSSAGQRIVIDATQTGTQFSAGISGGNTAGDTGTVAGRVVLAGGQSITLSGSTNGVSETISIVGATTSQSVQTQGQMSLGVSTGGNTAGDTGVTGTRMVFVGSNNITLSQATAAAGGTITISGPSAVAQTNQTLGMYALSQTVGQSSSTTMDARTMSLNFDGIVSGGFSGGSLRISATTAAQTAESQSIGMSNVGNTSGTTGVASGAQLRFVLAGGNNITLSQSLNGASGTVTISGPNTAAQSAQTLGMYAVQNTTGQSSSTTMDARTLSVAGDGAVSVGYSAGSLRISAPTQTVESQSIGMSNVGNTSGTTGVASGGQVRFVFAGGNNITLSQSLNGASGTITISAPNLGAGAMSAGVSNLGNSAGATGITGTQLVLVGSNNITLSQTTGAKGGTVSLIGGAGGGFSAGVSTGGNTAGATGVSGTQMVLVGSGVVSLSQTTGANGNTVSINAPATSSLVGASGIKISTNGSTISIGYGLSLADWENMPRQQASLMSHLSGFSKTPIYWNDLIAGDLTAKSLAFAVSMVTASQPLSLSAHLGVYSIVNSTSASLMGSVSEAYVVSSASSVSLSGVRNLIMTGIGTHATLSTISGGRYMIGMMFSATATNVMNASLLGASGGAGPLGAIHPGTNNLSAGTNQGIQTMAGRGSVTVNAMPANVAASDIINQGTAGSMALHPWIYIRS
jgi:hypothetical protein